jgi:hypothetical protein
MISRYNPDSMEGVTPPFSGIFALRPVTSALTFIPTFSPFVREQNKKEPAILYDSIE